MLQHNITILRDTATQGVAFRKSSRIITQLLVAKAAEQAGLTEVQVKTPLETTTGARIEAPIILVPILRAGLGMLEPAMEMLPNVSVGYVGLERDEETAVASSYYNKLPVLPDPHHVFVMDPMLATGGSAVQTISMLKEQGALKLTMICVIAAPEGIDCLQQAHPEVPIITGVIDRELNERKYILPGLGDYGDRLFGT